MEYHGPIYYPVPCTHMRATAATGAPGTAAATGGSPLRPCLAVPWALARLYNHGPILLPGPMHTCVHTTCPMHTHVLPLPQGRLLQGLLQSRELLRQGLRLVSGRQAARLRRVVPARLQQPAHLRTQRLHVGDRTMRQPLLPC